jgi:GntR family transcriptional regulator / MocR family aminotransferase
LMVRHPPNNNQRAAALFLSLGHHDTLIRRLHKAYRSRWETMATALNTHLPKASRSPSFGGTAYWVKAPAKVDSEKLAVAALERGIFIEPMGLAFAGEPQPNSHFRLAFSSIDESKIESGIKLLAETIGTLK